MLLGLVLKHMTPVILHEKVLSRLRPHEHAEYTVRDISFLACSIFGHCYQHDIQAIFNINPFSLTFWYEREDGNIVLYRSGKENFEFSKILAEEFCLRPEYVSAVAMKLKSLTDEVRSFLTLHPSREEVLREWDAFVHLYSEFFAYHQACYWPGDYIAKLKSTEHKNTIDCLSEAYAYNEMVIPEVEAYVRKLNLADYHYQEAASSSPTAHTKHPLPSLLFLDGGMMILPFNEAKKLHEAIQKDYEGSLGEGGVRGLGVNHRKIRGSVRVIIDLADLEMVQPGEILVTTMTRPQYNSAIKKAAAIVTDEGGILCHAAILAREFDIPCIVGTKNATQFLHTGDMVEVDADGGRVIKILV